MEGTHPARSAGGRRAAALLALAGVLGAGCWAAPRAMVRVTGTPLAVPVAGLSSCHQGDQGVLDIDPRRPLTLLVHGCNFSMGGFKTLADVFEAHGQQAICFNYDDRDRLETSSAELIGALEALQAVMGPQEITVIGHSQGGLVARRALVADRARPLRAAGSTYRLVTISSPFAGIEASSHCRLTWLHVLSLGASAAICQGVTGSKWTEIYPGSEFMTRPGLLGQDVASYLKVVTDERGSCLRPGPAGGCAARDEVFSLAEQYNVAVDADGRVAGVEVKAGHVEIVGEHGTPPLKLLRILQEQGILAEAPAGRRDELSALVQRLYGRD